MAEEKVKIRLPKDKAQKKSYMIVGVNGKLMKIPLGEMVEIPASYLEVIQDCMAAEDVSDVYIEQVKTASKKQTN